MSVDLFAKNYIVQNIGGGVGGPIFSFGKNKRRVEIYRQIAEEYKLNYQKTFLLQLQK